VAAEDQASCICPGGMKLACETNKCFCPMGSYKDAESGFACKVCPSGTTTTIINSLSCIGEVAKPVRTPATHQSGMHCYWDRDEHATVQQSSTCVADYVDIRVYKAGGSRSMSTPCLLMLILSVFYCPVCAALHAQMPRPQPLLARWTQQSTCQRQFSH
jgi:hypothetical protein